MKDLINKNVLEDRVRVRTIIMLEEIKEKERELNDHKIKKEFNVADVMDYPLLVSLCVCSIVVMCIEIINQ